MKLISITDAAVSYEGDVAFSHVSFSVEEGDYLVILGENGSGKTSLMKAMLGLVRLKSGKIECANAKKQGGIGYLPQQTRIQKDFPASVEEVVRSGLVSRMKNPFFMSRREKERAEEQMRSMDVWEMRRRPYRALSGGQQQRVLLARAMCATDRILLLDEPVTGLDPQTTEEMYERIRALNEKGVAIITVSHDMRGALRDAKHVLVMDREMRFYGTKAEYDVWRKADA